VVTDSPDGSSKQEGATAAAARPTGANKPPDFQAQGPNKTSHLDFSLFHENLCSYSELSVSDLDPNSIGILIRIQIHIYNSDLETDLDPEGVNCEKFKEKTKP
jgi:hypothetical protein